MNGNGYKELTYSELEAPEVGDPVDIEVGALRIRATWLGTVGNAKELGQAMRLMAELEKERQANETMERDRHANS